LLALESRTEVAVTAPVLSVLPCATAHRPTLRAEAVVVSVLVMLVEAATVTVVGAVVPEAEVTPALGVDELPWGPPDR